MTDMVPFVIPDSVENSLIAIPRFSAIPVGDKRIEIHDGHFRLREERFRVWGVNLCFGANFPTHTDAETIAVRLHGFGVNSIRLHHMDMQPFPRGIWDPADATKLSVEAMDRLDFFIAQLAKLGIYVNLNLHVSRTHSEVLKLPPTFKPGTDNTFSSRFDKLVGMFTPALIAAQKKYARDLLHHRNEYRKVRYGDDPAVAFVEITNEDSLFMWQAEQRLRSLSPYYAAILQNQYNAWLKRRYATAEKLRLAWTEGEGPSKREGLGKTENPDKSTVLLFGLSETLPRALDRQRFLAETEKDYFDEMRRFVRVDLGCGAMVTGAIVFSPVSVYTGKDMDWIDAHAYWQHPRFPGKDWDAAHWTVEQVAMTDRPEESVLRSLAASRVAGKPFTVSEYNHSAPSDFQAECVPMLAAFAAAQDWDGIWFFTYSHGGQVGLQKYGGFFDIDANPAKWGFMRSGAAVFRDGGLPALPNVKTVALTRGDVLAELGALDLKHRHSMFAVAAELGGITWRDLLAVRLEVRLDQPKGPPPLPVQKHDCSLSWELEDGRGNFLARGPGAVVFTGHSGTRLCLRSGLMLSRPDFAAVIIAPLDGEPIARTRKLLVAVCGRCENTGMAFSADRRTVGSDWGSAPVCVEPVTADIASALLGGDQWKCFALGADGQTTGPAPLAARVGMPGKWLQASAKCQTMWYLLTAR